jgi:AraC-like DNA-binding protein
MFAAGFANAGVFVTSNESADSSKRIWSWIGNSRFRLTSRSNRPGPRTSEDFGSGVPQFVKPFVQDAALAASLLRLHRKLDRDVDSLNIENDLADVFIHLSERRMSEPRNDLAIRDEQNKILRVKDYLHGYYRKNISVEDLAEIAQLSRFHLMRTFRRDVGLSPHTYLTQIRVEAAKKLLSEGASIVDVASDIGFTDQSHFTRHFKRMTGVTPGQYLPRWRPNPCTAQRTVGWG